MRKVVFGSRHAIHFFAAFPEKTRISAADNE